IPSLDLVAARAGNSWERTGGDHYDVFKPFLQPIAASAREAASESGETRVATGLVPRTPERLNARPYGRPYGRTPERLPYPPSPVISGVTWAPPESIVRRARGSDNWPLTWGDDDLLYTAFGDGTGFEPP